MIDKAKWTSALAQRLALECRCSLMEAAELNASGGEWLVTDSMENEFSASLFVDEDTLDVFIDVKDTETDSVEYRFKLEFACRRVE